MMPDYEPLGRLLEALSDPLTERYRWTYSCNLGIAGTVHLAIDVRPYILTTEERDTILKMAAQLTNWSHA